MELVHAEPAYKDLMIKFSTFSPTLISACLSFVVLTLPTSPYAADKAPLNDACWDMSFSEDFDDLSLWDETTGTGRWKTSYIWGSDIVINNELQYYIDPDVHGLSPFAVKDGILQIIADHTPDSLLEKVDYRPYISGVLTTENDFSQQHGRFEVFAKVPEGRGLWSAFWLLPSFDQWPEGVAVLPEIDVMEHLGHQTRTYHTTLHTNQTGKLSSHPYDHTERQDLTKDFHLYSVVWTPERVDWYLDKQWKASHPTPSDFTRPVHFLLNLAVGGNWPGEPDRRTRFPARYSVDYVRAWTAQPNCN